MSGCPSSQPEQRLRITITLQVPFVFLRAYFKRLFEIFYQVLLTFEQVRHPHDYDTWRYRERYLVECFTGKIKHFRRVFSRFDKLACRYLGFVQVASTLIWLR